MHRVLVLAGAAAVAAAKTVPETAARLEGKACRDGFHTFKFCDTGLSKAERVDALIAELRDEEIPPLLTARAQTGGGGGSPGPANNVTRLGLPQYDWGLNCIHGVQSSCVMGKDGAERCPTDFPNAVNLGATWNTSMWAAMGRIIGREVRALYVGGATEFSPWSGRPLIGLDCWSPNINLNRDPRWGRNSEVPGEDPRVNGAFGVAVTQAQQWNPTEPRYLQSVVTLKHWAVYQNEDIPAPRGAFNAKVANHTLSSQYFPAFAASVKRGGAKGVMCSYNAVNGVPACANQFLDATLRDTWGYEGYVTSDTTALSYIYEKEYHHWVNTSEQAACAALQAHTDIASDTVYHSSLMSAVAKGLCSRDLVTSALRNTLGLLFDMGLFDPAEEQPLWSIPLDVVGSQPSLAVAAQAARESMVLLKNDATEARGLPFAKAQKVGVFGPHYNATSALVGDYFGQICPSSDGMECVQSPLAAIQAVASSAVGAAGCDVKTNDSSRFGDVLAAVDGVDAAVLVFGIDLTVEKEEHDRTAIDLPGAQRALLKQVLEKLAAQGKPAVVVLVNGGAVSLGKAILDLAPAVVEAFYPGRWGSQAIAATVFGDNDRLGGKMPYTVYPAEYVDAIDMGNMAFDDAATPGRSYRYYTGIPEWRFGHGLSLTEFAVDVMRVTGSLSCDDPDAVLAVRVQVTNTGARAGDTVVQVYKQGSKAVPPPRGRLAVIREIVEWKRVHLAAGEGATVDFHLTREMFLEVTAVGDRVCYPETRDVVVGDGNPEKEVPLRITLSGAEATVRHFPDV
eukprot:TRINITY_DN5856_c1_g3_i1.p1 TRINITY_DN5856_c1_g3~~TRINITY_DN5856_c1_g3_i1.p1  ORF type:complete len:791 (+),score=188.18 TRINITY_DN5856_c1_g3_i1:66-2438(+)